MEDPYKKVRRDIPPPDFKYGAAKYLRPKVKKKISNNARDYLKDEYNFSDIVDFWEEE